MTKLVFAGPVGAGKTTAIASLADVAPVSTDVAMSEGPMGSKTTTTVGLDFATVHTDDGGCVFLYGLPGQDRFDFMRRVVLEGALGVLLVLDGSAPDVAEQCAGWMDSLLAINPDLPFVVGITHTDAAPGFDLWAVREAVASRGAPPVFTFDAREREQAQHLVRALLVLLE